MPSSTYHHRVPSQDDVGVELGAGQLTQDPVGGQQPPPAVGREPETRSARPILVWSAVVVVLLAVLTTLGVTRSSMAVLDDPIDGVQGLVAGEPRLVRSDEWMRITPIQLGTLSRPDVDFQTPLALPVPAALDGSGGLVAQVLNPEAAAARAVAQFNPEAGFALLWHFSGLLFWVFFPLWLFRLGLGTGMSLVLSALVWFAPSNQWWSGTPAGILGTAAAASVASIWAADALLRSHWARGVLAVALAGLMLARLGQLYLVWALPLGSVVCVVTAAWLLVRPGKRRSAIAALAGTSIVAMAVTLWFVAVNSAYFSAIAASVYPGSRRSGGQAVGGPALFGGPLLGGNQLAGVEVVGTNLSEITSGYLVVGFVALALLALQFLRGPRPGVPAWVAAGLLAAWSTWCMLDWPASSAELFPLNLVSPQRLAQILAFLVVPLLALLLTAAQRVVVPRTLSLGLAVAVGIAGGLALWRVGGVMSATSLPGMSQGYIAVVSLLWAVGLALAVMGHRPRWWLVLAVLAVLTTAGVNPVQRGWGDLQSSAAARSLAARSQASPAGSLMAAQDLFTGAVLAANAIPALSGQQLGGPTDLWRELDPQGQYTDAWNRAAANLVFDWAAPAAATTITNPQPDLIVVSIDPCAGVLDRLGVQTIIATSPLRGRQCLGDVERMKVMGMKKWVYDRVGPQG